MKKESYKKSGYAFPRYPAKIDQSLLARFVLEDLWANKKRRPKGFKSVKVSIKVLQTLGVKKFIFIFAIVQ